MVSLPSPVNTQLREVPQVPLSIVWEFATFALKPYRANAVRKVYNLVIR